MESSPRAQERGGYPSPSPSPNPNPYPFPNQSLLPSPTSTTSSSSSSSNTTTNGAAFRHPNYHHHHHHHHSLSSPKQNHHHQPQQQNPPVTRSESNPYPTTFVQADTTSFKQVVQMLTGAAPDSAAAKSPTGPGRAGPDKPHCNPIPPIKTTPSKSKLYERRNSLKNNLRISPLIPSSAAASAAACAAGFSPRSNNNNNNYYNNAGGGEILSPSILDFPALVLSPVTPLIPDPFNRSPTTTTSAAVIAAVNKAAEEKAIAEKGFFLHPSPATTPRDSEPRLLPLFPVTSPRLSGSDHPSS